MMVVVGGLIEFDNRRPKYPVMSRPWLRIDKVN